MFVFQTLSFLAFILYVYVGFVTFRADRRSPVNKVFSLYCLVLALWAFNSTASNSGLHTKESAHLFYQIFAFTWNFFASIGLHFFLTLTGKQKFLSKKSSYVIIYLPAVIFTITNGFIAYQGQQWIDWQWVASYYPDKMFLYHAFTVYYILYLVIGAVITARWAAVTKIRRNKISGWLVFGSFTLSFLLGVFTDTVLPLLGIKYPPIAIVCSLIFAFGSFIAITQFRMMVLTPEIAADEILAHTMDIMVLVNPAYKIITVNPQTERLLGYHKKDLEGLEIDAIIRKDSLIDIQRHYSLKGYKDVQLQGFVVTRGSDEIPVLFKVSGIQDRAKEGVGSVIIAHDLRESLFLKKALHELQESIKRQHEELIIARRIQLNLIPNKSPRPNIAHYYQPMELVGGDFFDFIEYESDDRIGIFISDVSGHGVPAAFITSMIKSFLLQTAQEVHDPSILLKKLNENLRNLTAGYYVTAFFGIYHPQTKEFVYSNAGHNTPILLKKDQYKPLELIKNGIPLAVMSGKEMSENGYKFINHSVVLQSGEKLLLYTDGLTEAVNSEEVAKNPSAPDFEASGFYDYLLDYHSYSATHFIKELAKTLVAFHGSDNFDDDVCILCLDVK